MNTNTDLETAVTYHSAPSILYVVETDQTYLIDEKRGLSWLLQGTEAVIWDFLASGYSYQKIVGFISLLANLPEAGAEEAVLTTLENWIKQGILKKQLIDDQLDS